MIDCAKHFNQFFFEKIRKRKAVRWYVCEPHDTARDGQKRECSPWDLNPRGPRPIAEFRLPKHDLLDHSSRTAKTEPSEW